MCRCTNIKPGWKWVYCTRRSPDLVNPLRRHWRQQCFDWSMVFIAESPSSQTSTRWLQWFFLSVFHLWREQSSVESDWIQSLSVWVHLRYFLHSMMNNSSNTHTLTYTTSPILKSVCGQCVHMDASVISENITKLTGFFNRILVSVEIFMSVTF